MKSLDDGRPAENNIHVRTVHQTIKKSQNILHLHAQYSTITILEHTHEKYTNHSIRL